MASRKPEVKSAEAPSVSANGTPKASKGSSSPAQQPPTRNPNGIPDYRLEQLPFHIEGEWKDGNYHYKVVGDTTAPAPPLRPSKYLNREQSLDIYRLMITNRRMEDALERMYKQSKVIGGLYLSLGQEACSVASAYALGGDDWLGPMIRNQG
jgi:hypothetical protein